MAYIYDSWVIDDLELSDGFFLPLRTFFSVLVSGLPLQRKVGLFRMHTRLDHVWQIRFLLLFLLNEANVACLY